MDKREVIARYFGHEGFRSGQEAVIDALAVGRDALAVMPTGGGKSLCYQAPALMLEGVTLVVSPLISLMKDQVMALRAAGVSAAYINSSLSPEHLRAAYRHMREGEYKIVYIAPERLDGDGFIALAQSLPIALVAVDEAHCISQWGQDFRPSYLRIADFLGKLPRRPTLAAFTATATAQVRDDIERILGLRQPLRVTTGFDRPNLSFEVLRPASRSAALRALVEERRGKSGIIYCATRAGVEQVCAMLRRAGIPATRYHAGLSDEERMGNQEDFIYDRAPVMAATNAFGMGIDKSNVSYVIHYNMPKSIEAYYQEAGRAGRDGQSAECILIYSPSDVRTARFLIESSSENSELDPEQRALVRRQDMERLSAMTGYCKTASCLRGYILDYFGQAHGERCENCGNCRTELCTQDVTAEAQMALSCIRRAQALLGYPIGAALVARVLRGSGDKRLAELGLDGLSTYGLLRGRPRPWVRALLERLEDEGYARTDPAHGGMELTVAAGEVLFHGARVEMAFQVDEPAVPKRGRGRKAADAAGEGAQGLFDALRAVRFELAQRERVPAYIVFSNATLADMAIKQPHSADELLAVSGVGQAKAARYGEAFLEAIARYERGEGAQEQ